MRKKIGIDPSLLLDYLGIDTYDILWDQKKVRIYSQDSFYLLCKKIGKDIQIIMDMNAVSVVEYGWEWEWGEE